MKNGIQLYNFRKELKQDFRGALKEIAKLGFDGVEFAVDYGGLAPAELAAYLKELHLECAGAMFKTDALLNSEDIAYDYAEKLHSPAVTISAMCDFKKEWETITEHCRKIGSNAAKRGLVFSYHNHWAEFERIDGVPAMELILSMTDPSNVFMEPDVCWLTRAGVKPAEFLEKYAARIRQVHMKDIQIPGDPNTTTELGKGVVDLKSTWNAALKTSCQWLIYEQDYTLDPFKSAAESLAYLKKYCS